MNLYELLIQTVARWPEKSALIEGDKTVSYRELDAQITALASSLGSLHLPPGSRVGLAYPNSVHYIALTYALWRANFIVVPVPTECPEAELVELTATLQLGAIFSQKPLPHSQPFSSEIYFTRLTPAAAQDNHDLNIAFIRFTSGTTNARKGVVLTHETIRDRITAANQALGITAQDTVMWCLPMAHHFLITIVLYLSQGATIVLARHLLARSFLQAIQESQGTVLYAAPFHYSLLARDGSDLQIPSVRLAVSTTCALPQTVAEDFFRRFNLPLIQGLGVIELGLVCLNTDDPLNRSQSVGRPVNGFQVRVHEPDAEGCGDILVAGPGMFDAYANPWLPRAQAAPDGWFATGDVGRIDEAGFLHLVGRKTAVINLAGRKVFPEEIEAVINRHPAVRESRAYGSFHPHLGELVEADIVLEQPDADLESVRDHCRTNLASFKVPTRLNPVHALPRTAVTGKIRRTEVPA